MEARAQSSPGPTNVPTGTPMAVETAIPPMRLRELDSRRAIVLTVAGLSRQPVARGH
ncbi:hypothetical protein FHR33_000262 [Nonomuraea dietziae]|uniref:Uncharacterized protein n=1 Tax=Nonomuraea dietziae TaxID=65515 RepID=A0A7W5YKR8_9ACTN|nr:hypothetical protein [Nonomuraea dietziae]